MIPESFRALIARFERPRDSKVRQVLVLLSEINLGNRDQEDIAFILDLVLDGLHDHNDEIQLYKKHMKQAIERDSLPCWDYEPDETTLARWKAEKKEGV